MRNLTTKEMYDEMIDANGNVGQWVNPRFQDITNPEFPDHFMIKMDSFRSIHSPYSVEIYSIQNWENEVIVHCKRGRF